MVEVREQVAAFSSVGIMYLYREVGMGLVADIFSTKRIKRLPGSMALAHNRYSTAGESKIMNAQPCPDCKGAGCYDHAPVGSLLCPPCDGTGRIPAPPRQTMYRGGSCSGSFFPVIQR